MAAVAQHKRRDARDVVEGERRVKMREQGAAARDLPFQRVAKSRCVNGDEQEVVLAGEMFRRRFFDLIRSREMDEAVREVDGGAVEDARRFSPRATRARRRFCK